MFILDTGVFGGEFWVKQELKKLPIDKYHVLNNIMIQVDGKTHQIDHIVVSKFGIFVIEMKNFYGMITGDEYDKRWIQHLGKHKYYFKNPIHQNYGHVQALKKLLGTDDDSFIPVICISNQATLKVNVKSSVVQVDDLASIILKHSKTIIDDMEKLTEIIVSNNIIDKRKRKLHVTNIREKVQNDKLKVDNNICPLCGNKLVERSSKYGKFTGCSNYPRCKFKK